VSDNYTRFLLLSRLANPPLKISSDAAPGDLCTYFYALPDPREITSLINKETHNVEIHTLLSRPAPSDAGTPGNQYPTWVLVELAIVNSASTPDVEMKEDSSYPGLFLGRCGLHAV
jgi:hypothetical protein